MAVNDGRELSLYSTARKALHLAKTTDEIREIHDRAEAARQYARRACDRVMEMDAAEIRVRAERRLGELLIEMKNKKLIVRNGKANRKLGQFLQSDLKIPNSTIRQARALGAVPLSNFEAGLSDWRRRYESATNIPLPLTDIRDRAVYNQKFKRIERYKRLKSRVVDDSDAYDTPRTIDQIKVGDLLYAHLARYQQEGLHQALLMRLIALRFANAESVAQIRNLISVAQLKALDNLAGKLAAKVLPMLDRAINEEEIRP